MKELTIEQKARAYDDAKARMSRAFNSNRCTIGFMNEIFPEFREDPDEVIRTALKQGFFEYGNSFTTFGGITVGDIIAWLEKQCEQHSPVDINKMVDEFAHTEVNDYGIPSMIEVYAYRKGIEDALEKQGKRDARYKEK